MGANNSTRRVSFESDENENITVVKGIRVCDLQRCLVLDKQVLHDYFNTISSNAVVNCAVNVMLCYEERGAFESSYI